MSWKDEGLYWAWRAINQIAPPTPTVKAISYATIYHPNGDFLMRIAAVVFDDLTPRHVNQIEIESYRDHWHVQCPINGYTEARTPHRKVEIK
jgi:hypothetical protein